MLVIRFFRTGKKNQPSFKIVVTDKRRPPRGGRFVEEVGFWNPLTKEKALKKERIEYWLSKGAKPSDSIYNLLVKEKVLKGKKINVYKKSKKKKKGPTESSSNPETQQADSGAGIQTGKEENKKEIIKPVKKEETNLEEKPEKKKEEPKREEKPKKTAKSEETEKKK